MPLSTDVNLPRDHQPVFPNRCVRCGIDPEGVQIKIWTHTIGWWTAFLWIFGRPHSVQAPACAHCRWMIRLQRWGSLTTTIIVAVAVMLFVWPMLDQVARPVRKWVALGLILLCLSPLMFLGVLVPPPFEITAYKKSVDYEFRDEAYAEEFAQLNEHAEWVTIS